MYLQTNIVKITKIDTVSEEGKYKKRFSEFTRYYQFNL